MPRRFQFNLPGGVSVTSNQADLLDSRPFGWRLFRKLALAFGQFAACAIAVPLGYLGCVAAILLLLELAPDALVKQFAGVAMQVAVEWAWVGCFALIALQVKRRWEARFPAFLVAAWACGPLPLAVMASFSLLLSLINP
jgi:hypothetical protein